MIIAIYGATIGQLGILSSPATTNQACCVFFPKIPELNFTYTFLLLKQIRKNLISIAFGGAQQNISQEVIKKFKIFFLKHIIIKEFNRIVVPILNETENLYRTVLKLKQSRDLLLPRLISSKLSVEDLDIKFPPSMEEENA